MIMRQSKDSSTKTSKLSNPKLRNNKLPTSGRSSLNNNNQRMKIVMRKYNQGIQKNSKSIKEPKLNIEGTKTAV